MRTIKHANIFYVKEIHSIGGVETYVYELAKKYKDLDIAVVCKDIAPSQKARLNKFCRVYIHHNEPIECKVAIINWDTSIIDYINEDAKIYQGIHADYTHPSQGKVPEDDRITTYLAITEEIKKNFIKLTGRTNVIVCRNPLELEEEEKTLVIVSPTRLTPEKGGEMMLQLANTLVKLKINFIWLVLTTAEYKGNPIFTNKNVLWVKNRLDVGTFIQLADWVVLPSETEGDSYSFKEALYRGVPLIVRKLPYFKEIGIKDGENALFINSSNIEEVAKKMVKPLKFEFKQIEDGYKELLSPSKSTYKEERNMKVKVRCIKSYLDVEDNEMKNPSLQECSKTTQYEWIVKRERAEYLEDLGLVEILEEIVETNKLQIKDEEIKKETKPRKKKN